jgi:glycosyltransferase involved in cell wall biosynthesis
LIDNKENSGLAKVRNKGISEAKAEYIAWLDADDISHPFRLGEQVKLLDAHPEIGVCGTWVEDIGITRPESLSKIGIFGTRVENAVTKIKQRLRYPSNSQFIRCRMLFDDPLATSSVMLRRELLIEQKPVFDLNYPPAEDYELWQRLSNRCEITNIPKVLTYYRIHENQTSTKNVLKQKESIWNIQKRQLEQLNVNYSDDEKQIHRKIGAWDIDVLKDFVTLAHAWLLKLQNANSKVHFYPEPEFTYVLAEKWFFVCRGAAGLGLRTWLMYWNSPLRKYCEFHQHIYVFAKCLIKW